MTTSAPDKTLSLQDFISHAKEKGCLVENPRGECFIGDPPSATNYPHVHVWQDDTIALSVGKSTNQKIGKNGEISIDDLKFAFDRFGKQMKDGPLKETIKWVLASAS